jgi:hypothetical protein
MADPTLVPIPDLPPAPGNWNLTWQIAIANPATKRAYRLPSSDYADTLVEQGAFADIRNTKFYVAGRGNPGDPAPGDTTIVDATLQGYTFAAVNLRNTGYLQPGLEYDFDNVDTIQFFSLDPEVPGYYEFNAGDVVAIQFEPKISSIVAAPGSVGKLYAGVKRQTATGTILPDDYQKIQEVLATASAVTLTLPPVADYPPGVCLTITTFAVNTYQTGIQTQVGEKIFITGGNTNLIYLGVDEFVTLVPGDDGAGNAGWFIASISESFKQVGKVVWSYVPLPNTIILDGTPLSKALYPRGVQLVNKLNTLYAGAVVSDGTWQADPRLNRTKWSFGPDANNLRRPDWRGLSPRSLDLGRGIDTDRGADGSVPGSYQTDQIKQHNHLPANTKFNKLLASADEPDGEGGHFTAAIYGGTYNDKRPKVNNSGQMQDFGGTETRGINGGLLPLLCI